MHVEEASPAYGFVAEYETAEALVRAATKVYDEGYRRIDAYSPFPVHGLPEAIGFEDPRLQWTIFISGCIGALSGWFLQYWISVAAFPHNVGGRPLFSWPTWIPPTFECTVLFAAFGAVLGMLGFNKLPMPHHPVFSAPRFDRASQDSFFLSVEAKDPKYDETQTRALLESTGASNISLVGQDEEGDWL